MTIGCPDCGALEEIPSLPVRASAVCVLCRNDLERTSGRSITAALACSVATLLLLVPVNTLPLLQMTVLSFHSDNVIAVGIGQLWRHGWLLLAGLSALYVVGLPFVRFGLLSAVLGSIRLGWRPAWLGPAFRWAVWLDIWAMLDVFLLAACVGWFRLDNVNQARIAVDVGGACFIAAAFLTMLSRASLDRRTVWRAIGKEVQVPPGEPVMACWTCDLIQPVSKEGAPCPRCGAKLYARKRRALIRTTALLVAALLLVAPSNFYPMNVSNQLGTQLNYTIFTGVRDLFKNGLWPLGALVFCTSILIPVVKILAISWCVCSVWRRSARRLIAKTRTFRMVAELGRWSKADPFTIVFFVPLMNFGPLGSDSAGWGATAFMLMTSLTMFATNTFDPRLMWDAAESRLDE